MDPTPPVAILCGGRGDPAAGAHAHDPQAAGRDRRPADPLARHPALRAGGLRGVRAVHGLPRRADRGVRRDARRGRTACAWLRRHRLDTPTGGRIAARGRAPGRRPRFCATYADGIADIDLRRAAGLPRRPRRRGDDDGRAPELQFGVTELATARTASPASARSRAPSTGSTAASSSSSRAVLDHLEPDQRPGARAAGAPGRRRRAARLPPRGLLGLHGHLQGRRAAQRPLGRRRAALEDLDDP